MSLRRKFSYGLAALLLISIVVGTVFSSSHLSFGPGPSTAEIERRGIYAFFHPRPSPSCMTKLQGMVNTCSTQVRSNVSLKTQAVFDRTGWLGVYQYEVGHHYLMVQNRHAGGFIGAVSVTRAHPYPERDRKLLCQQQVFNQHLLEYECELTETRSMGRHAGSNTRVYKVYLSYHQATGRLSWVQTLDGERVFQSQRYISPEMYVLFSEVQDDLVPDLKGGLSSWLNQSSSIILTNVLGETYVLTTSTSTVGGSQTSWWNLISQNIDSIWGKEQQQEATRFVSFNAQVFSQADHQANPRVLKNRESSTSTDIRYQYYE